MSTLAPIKPLASTSLESTAIPIDLPTTTYKTLYRVVTGGLNPGDQLDISADARVTNDAGYTVGVGWHLWAYSYSDPLRSAGPWWRISHLMGDNVPVARHHMPLHISYLHAIPEDWPAGDRMVIVLRADAHSTAWASNGGGDTLSVDAGYGQLIVRQWAAPAPVSAPEPCPAV